MENKFIEIVQEPSYWVEEINNLMYDAMIRYMEDHNLNRTEFSTYLGISKGRLSQILNSGEINFSIEKLFSIALKIGKIPNIKLEDKDAYVQSIRQSYVEKINAYYIQEIDEYGVFDVSEETKIIKLPMAFRTVSQSNIAYC